MRSYFMFSIFQKKFFLRIGEVVRDSELQRDPCAALWYVQVDTEGFLSQPQTQNGERKRKESKKT
jgi:hypothetical protein